MFQGFYDLVFNVLFKNGENTLNDMSLTLFGYEIAFDEYICSLISLVCTIIVYVLCCLCVWKVIRLFGRLWSRF